MNSMLVVWGVVAGLLELAGLAWLIRSRRARERALLALVDHVIGLSAEVAALRSSIDAMRRQALARRRRRRPGRLMKKETGEL